MEPTEDGIFENIQSLPNSSEFFSLENENEIISEVIEELSIQSGDPLVPPINISTDYSPEQWALMEQTVEEIFTLPLNPPIIQEATSRFSGALWYEKIQEKTIILAGLGGIGSYVGLLLARMQPASIFMCDNDVVELGNLSGQLYSTSSIGGMKVFALADMMVSFGQYFKYMCVPEKYTEISPTRDIMICGFDNMAARKIFFNNWTRHVENLPEDRQRKCLFIDGRLSAEYLQIFCLKGDDSYFINKYKEEQLFSDEEALPTLCSYKQTSFMANMIGSLIVNLFVNFVANECEPLVPRDVPYFTEYSGENMFFNTVQ